MVVFGCDGCGEMLKKNQVDAHASRCRRCDSVSCLDCSVAFFGDDYRAHTSCLTEAERYEKKPLTSSSNKKRNPQQEWMDIVETCTTTAPGHLRNYMQTMATLDNIPRKEKQFRNFTANSLNLRGRNESIVGELWKVLFEERQRRQEAKQIEQKIEQQRKEEQQAANNVKKSKQDNDKSDDDDDNSDSSDDDEEGVSETKNNKAKRTNPSSNGDNADHDGDNKKSMDSTNMDIIDILAVKKAMKKTLKKAPNRSMKLKELRKVLGKKLSIPKSARKQLKAIVLKTPSSSSKKKDKVDIFIDGKIVTLR